MYFESTGCISEDWSESKKNRRKGKPDYQRKQITLKKGITEFFKRGHNSMAKRGKKSTKTEAKVKVQLRL